MLPMLIFAGVLLRVVDELAHVAVGRVRFREETTTLCRQVSATGRGRRQDRSRFSFAALEMINASYDVTSSVYPSGVARATIPAPRLPPAPGRLSTMTG